MKNLAIILSATFLTGCATPHYFNRAPDATPISTEVSISELPTSNTVFRVFDVNGNLALLRKEKTDHSSFSKTDALMSTLNSLLIFDKNQRAELRAACKAIVEYNEHQQREGVKIIKFDLRDNKETKHEDASAVALGNSIYMEGSSYFYRHSFFALQYLCEKTAKGRIRSSVSYQWQENEPVSISKKTVEALLNDINSQIDSSINPL